MTFLGIILKKGTIMRSTRQRQIILDELCKLKSHPTADELFHIVRKEMPRISLGTVYRNLELLCRCGKIQKIEVGGVQKRFDGNAGIHYHIRCTSCNRVDDIEMDTDNGIEKMAAKISGYDVVRHHTEFAGVCPECKQAKKKSRKKEGVIHDIAQGKPN